MKAFLNDDRIKEKYINRMQDHIDKDELIRGVGFENGRGCAVGCTLNRYEHSAFETELGIPEWIARLLDVLHENTSDNVWPSLALDFLKAIPVGANVELIKPKVHSYMLSLNKTRVENIEHLDNTVKTKVMAAINACIDHHSSRAVTAAEVAEAVWWSTEAAGWPAAEVAEAVWWSTEAVAQAIARAAAATARAAGRDTEAEADLIAKFLISELKSLCLGKK